MKRAISLLLSMVMVFSMLCTASAAETGTLTISNAESVAAGSEVEIAVSIANNPGLWGGKVRIAYDEALEFVDCTGTDLLGDSVDFFYATSGNIVTLMWDNSKIQDSTANGDLAMLKLKVPADATVEDQYTISFQEVDLWNADEVQLELETANGTITIDGVYTYEITAIAGENGSISPEGTVTVKEGNSQTFTITPDDGYHIEDVTVDNESVGAKESYTFSDVDCDHTITAAFAAHDYKEEVTEPTCTADGVKIYTCTACGETKTEIIPAAHKWDEGKVTTEPTCTADGVKIYTCTACGETKTEIIPAAHKWDEGKVTTEPTCTVKGEKTYTCTVEGCGATKTEEVPALGHDYVDGTCTRCGDEQFSGGGSGGGSGSGSGSGSNSGNTGTVVEPEEKVPFTDINGHWAADVIGKVYIDGIMNGVSDTEFGPDMTLTRGMVVTILYGLEGKPEVTAENKFTDVSEDQYYCNAVIWAYENGIVKGMGESVFAPNDNITRQQLATIMLQYAKFQGADVSKTTSLAAYKDADQVSAWAVEGMEWAVANGIISGKGDGILDAQGTATRAECAQIIYNFIGE